MCFCVSKSCLLLHLNSDAFIVAAGKDQMVVTKTRQRVRETAQMWRVETQEEVPAA